MVDQEYYALQKEVKQDEVQAQAKVNKVDLFGLCHVPTTVQLWHFVLSLDSKEKKLEKFVAKRNQWLKEKGEM